MPLEDIINRYTASSGDEPEQSVPEEGTQDKSVDMNNNQMQNSQQTAGIQQSSSDTLVPKKLEEMTPEELIGELKKWQRIAEERKVNLEKLSQGQNIQNNEYLTKFLEESKSDFWGAYKRYSEKIGLPSYELVMAQSKIGDIDTQVEAYQNEVLVPEIMEKYNLEEFEFNPQEAWIPKTPSYEFRQRTEEYMNKLKSQFEEQKQKAEEFLRRAEEVNKRDIDELKKMFDSEEEFMQYFNEFNNPKDLSLLTDPENHILSLKNLFRGYYFDKLVEKIVKREVEKVHNQYAKLGIRLPKAELPLDTSNLKDENIGQPVPVDEDKLKYSPLYRTLKRTVG